MDTLRPNAGRPTDSPFNGAMALQPWIRARLGLVGRLQFGPSMEPWPFSHGYPAWAQACNPKSPTFNGAMALQPWIRGRLHNQRLRRQPFNGAMALQPWIHGCFKIHNRGVEPSMEPWPFSHGYAGIEAVPRTGQRAFNGAMALQPWILSLSLLALSDCDLLQWSHGPSAMDTTPESDNGTTPQRPFNGAMALQPWIPAGRVRRPGRVGDLQWSHGPSAMDTTTSRVRVENVNVLQWSHGPSAMDTGIREHGRRQVSLPSMEPWPFSHGYNEFWAISILLIDPSMEPWPFSHGYARRKGGRARRRRTFNGAMALQPWIPRGGVCAEHVSATLQWSHGPSAMDTPTAAERGRWRISLQWSHGPSAMDTSRIMIPCRKSFHLQWSHGPSAMDTTTPASSASSSTSFNGAMALQPWIHR